MASNILEIVGIILAAGSLFIALLAYHKSGQAQDRANSIQAQLLKIEEQREAEALQRTQTASLRPALRKVSNTTYRLYLRNVGVSEARNVKVLINGIPLDNHPAAVSGDQLASLIGPNTEVSCLFNVLHCQPPFGIEIAWEDNSGQLGLFRGTISF